MIRILGAGSWGTALAQACATKGHRVVLWDRDAQRLKEISETRSLSRVHPGVELSPNIHPQADLAVVLEQTGPLVFAIPSYTIGEFLESHATSVAKQDLVISAAKGIHSETLHTVSEVFAHRLGRDWAAKHMAVLSGPSFAHDVVRGNFTAVTFASPRAQHQSTAQYYFHTPSFHLYSSTDVIGVELGGALKNVVAIATGAMDGLGFGLNARAALMTRALTEIRRIGVAKGSDPLTFSGLAGLGDLILTCTGEYSRNRRVGMLLAQGKPLKDVIREVGQVAEGIRTAKSSYLLAKHLSVEVPIFQTVYDVLYEGMDLNKAIHHLLQQAPCSDT